MNLDRPTLDYYAPSTSTRGRRNRGVILALFALALIAAATMEVMGVARTRKGSPVDITLPLLRRWGPFAIAAVLSLVPPVRRAVATLLDRLREPSPRTRRLTTIGFALLGCIYLYGTARWQGRDLSAKEQDESMYLIQTQMLARGHLWMPQHPCAEFFESFHVLVRPVYAGMYFPGTALAYAPSVWLHLPPWTFSILIGGLCVGMTYRVLAEMIDGVAGILGALLLVSTLFFRHLSTMVMSHMLMLLLGLVMTWAFLRWRRRRSVPFAFVLGLFAGWAAITRPLDALCYAAPVTIAVAWEMYRAGDPLRRWIATAALAALAALPFLSLQLLLDYGTTGHPFHTPVTMYHQHYWPHVQIGYTGDASDYRPPTDLPQFSDYYSRYIVPSFTEFRDTPALKLLAKVRVPLLLGIGLPSFLFAALIPLAIFQLKPSPRWAFVLAAPLFLLGYATFMFFRKHYGVVVLPPLFAAVFLGARAVESAWPQWRRGWSSFFTLALLGLIVMSLPEVNPSVRDQVWPTPILHRFNTVLRRIDHKPAIVLVRYSSRNDAWAQEPVYNTDVAWPDDATVIRAHDLNEKNVRLFEYYAQRQPQRAVYRFDKSDLSITHLGQVADLARQVAPSPH